VATDLVQLTSTPLVVTFVNVMFVGAAGGVVSTAWVVNVLEAGAEKLKLASRALTRTVYVVLAVNPVRVIGLEGVDPGVVGVSVVPFQK
jgi:imidazole glycerol phosphate synthase subunit HisF